MVIREQVLEIRALRKHSFLPPYPVHEMAKVVCLEKIALSSQKANESSIPAQITYAETAAYLIPAERVPKIH
ncbi:hypothetical protein HNY73_009268 [Argiope bruennichi]|uniref:Uncharacterized protein n=1 Tax=Argiope bruennichi TaxID=94029 RepID=A0A8T0F906_ARGBR|nr:hypothetical protein HNY73_009268 [Argiope bruennichi]